VPKNSVEWTVRGYSKSDFFTVSENNVGPVLTMGLSQFTKEFSEKKLASVLKSLAKSARDHCPVDTGLLKSTITYFISPEKVWGAYGSDLYYAGFVNFGTSKMEGAHFLEAAIDDVMIKESQS
jgi:hypothetical protein